MRQIRLIFENETAKFLRSGGTYALLAFFYLICGGFMFITLLQGASAPRADNPFRTFWMLQWVGNVVLVPLLTMRLLSAQRKAGLLSATLSTPTSPTELILGEFAAAYGLYLLCWLAAPICMGVVALSGIAPSDAGYLFDFSAMVGGGIFCIGSGFMLVALGVFSSSLTRNGWLSGALTACLILLMIMLPTMLEGLADFPDALNYLHALTDFADGRISLGVLGIEVLSGLVLLAGATLVVERGAE